MSMWLSFIWTFAQRPTCLSLVPKLFITQNIPFMHTVFYNNKVNFNPPPAQYQNATSSGYPDCYSVSTAG